MSVFGGDSSWRSQTPAQRMIDVLRAAGSFGDSFSKSFEGALDRKHQGKQQDKRLGQDAQQFRDKFIEEQRQFNILHPDPSRPWNSEPITAPPIDTPPPQTPPSYDPFKSPVFGPQTFGMMRFADGGRPPVDEPSVVGERGPEVFVPDQSGTIVPNEETGMRYDRNGTGAITPTVSSGWDGKAKPNWMTDQPVFSWRATNAVDAVGKITQARTFSDLTKIQAENPEAGMYPQFQNALQQKSMVLARGESIMLRQKQLENSSVAAKSALDLSKRFNEGLLQLPDAFQVAVRSLGEAANNKDGTPSPAAIGILTAGKQFMEAELAKKAEAAKLVATRMDAKGTVFGQPKPDAAAAAGEIKYETPFPDMPWIKAAVTPKGTLHVIKGEAPLTVGQRQRMLETKRKAMKELDSATDDAQKANLNQQISLIDQTLNPSGTASTNAPANPKDDPLGLFK